ncbi:MAG: hypothetical protein HYU66_16360 [Armatimonadetes bacterium]|nr:hypothetical protein [Armatimonadota bacterium]
MPALQTPGVPPLGAGVADADRLPELELSLEPARPYRWVFGPGELVLMDWRAAPTTPVDQVVLTAWDWELRPVAQSRAASPSSGWLRIRVAGRGTYVLTLDALRGEACVGRLARSLAVCPSNRGKGDTWRKGEFWVGQCSFPGWQNAVLQGGHAAHPVGLSEDASRELDAELVARMGAGVARINFPVFRRDELGLDLDFALADRCVETFASHGLRLDLQLFEPYGAGRGPVLTPYLDVPLEQAPLYPIRSAPYRRYVDEVARRYGQHALFYQVGNEPSNALQYKGTPREFVDQVRWARETVRSRQPLARITNGGYCNTLPAAHEIARSIGGLVDFISYHWHGDLAGLKTFHAEIQAMHREANAKPLHLANTEMGCAMPTVASERTNAVVELQKLLWCWAHGHEGVLLYSSRELWWPRQFSYDGVSDYGFVDHFFCPRFAYGGVSAVLDRYAGYRFDKVLAETDNLHVYAFRRRESVLVAAFARTEPVSIRLTSKARRAAVIDPMGNAVPATDPAEVTLVVGEYPQAIALEGAAGITLSVPHRPGAPG